jgi:hypothetical protein
MTSEETINLLKTISQAVDKLASFEREKKSDKPDTIISEDDKLSSTLSTTEKRRWESMSKILAKTIKDVVFPKGEERVGRPEFKQKEVKDLVLSPTFAKIQDASNKWLKMLLGALALVGGIIAGVLAEIGKIFKGIKTFLGETKIGKFIEGIFQSLKAKIPKAILSPISKFFETIGRLFKVFEAGKGPLFIMKAFPTLFKFFEDYIRIASKVFQYGIKIGRLFGKLLGPVIAIFEVVVGLVQAFTDPKLSDKSFLQKIITGFTQGILNFFDFFEIFGLDLFKFETIRDRIEAIFKPFREGKWLQGLQALNDQLLSVIISIPGKIIGWIVGWFDKELGQKIMQFFDKFDLGKFREAIFKRIGPIFQNIKLFFQSIYEKLSPFLGPLLKILGGPVFLAFQMLKKAFEYAVPLMKGIGSLVSKVFGYIKNFFVMIFEGIKALADKISKVPFMKKIGEELKAIATESQVTEISTPAPAVAGSPARVIDITGQENIASEKFEELFSMKEDNTTEAFSLFGNQVENLNKTGSVTNKIAVDQLRETKTLNQKIDMLIEQLANSRNVVNNVLTQNSVNSFPQSTSVSDLRRYHRGAD